MTFRFSFCERHGSYDAERHKVCPECSAAVTAAPPDAARPSQLETQRPDATPTGRMREGGVTQRDHEASRTAQGRPTTTHGGRPTTTHGRSTTRHGRRQSQLATERPPSSNPVRTLVANPPSTRVHGFTALGLFALVGVLGYRQCSTAPEDAPRGPTVSATPSNEAEVTSQAGAPARDPADSVLRFVDDSNSANAAQLESAHVWPAVRHRARSGEIADICRISWLEMYDRLQRSGGGEEPGLKGQTPLMLAAESGSLETLQSLLGQGANVDERDALNHTALVYAARRARSAHAEVLLRAGADGRTRGLWDASGGSMSALDAALLEGARDTAQLIEGHVLQSLMRLQDADLAATDEAGEGPLHWVARYADARAAELLVERGAALELCNCPARPGDQHGMHRDDLHSATPLLVAIWAGTEDVARALLKSKANARAVDERGRGVFHVMRHVESMAMAEQLIRAGADPLLPDRDGKTPADVLAAKGLRAEFYAALTAAGHSVPRVAATLTDLFGVIRRLGGDAAAGPESDPAPVLAVLEEDALLVNETDTEGRTALFEAARQGLARVVETLVARGARVDVRDQRGVTPLHRARDKQAIAVLVRAGAAVDARDQAGSTPLHWQAATPGALDAVRALIDAGANPSLADAMGRTPLALAQRSGSADVVEYLEKQR